MSKDVYMGYAPLVDRYINGALTDVDLKMMHESAKINAAYVINADSSEYNSDIKNAPVGSTLIVPIKGAIMKESYCGDKGTAEIMEILKTAQLSNSIEKVVLDIDSGGGSVDGTFELADYIANEFNKPITAYVNGMACSAAYAIACACDEVIASHDSAQVGSIGVAISFRDYTKYNEANGIVEHYITADGSEDKNKAALDARNGDYVSIKEQSLNPTREIFVAEVKRNRPGVNDRVFSGLVYMAQDAIALGLVDKVMHIDTYINEGDKINLNSIFMFNKFPKLAALKGLSTAQLTDEVIATANREILENGIEGLELVREGALSHELETENTLKSTVANLEQTIAEREADVLRLTAEVERLGKIVPEGATTVVKGEADVIEQRSDELTDAEKRLQAQAAAELAKMNQ